MILSASASKVGLVSILAFIFILSWHLNVWQNRHFLDEDIWLKRVSLHQSNLSGVPLEPNNFLHSNSPGLAPLTIAALLKTLNISSRSALILSVSILVSFSAVLASLITYLMYPREIWWLAVFITIGFHYSLFRSTPPSIVASAVNPLLVLYGLYVWKKPQRLNLSIFGIITAVSFLTRWPAGTILAAPLWLALFFRLTRVQLIPALVSGGLTLIIIAPFTISDPIGLFRIIFLRSLLNFDHDIKSASLGLLVLLSKFYLALISMSLAVILLFQSGRWTKIAFPLLLLTSSALYMLAFSSIAAQSLRHWYPLIISWEVLLPYWIINLTPQRSIHFITIVIIILGQITVTWLVF